MLSLLAVTVGIALLVAILAALRARLIFELQATSILLLRSPNPGIIIYSLVFLPGTIIHELSHWLFAELLRVPTGKITIFPSSQSLQEKTQNLGSVETARTDPFRSLFIGAAPFLVGSGILVALSILLRDLWGVAPWWQLGLILYGLIAMGNSMIVSESDRKNWGIAIGVLFLLSLTLWHLGIRPTEESLNMLTKALSPLIPIFGLTATLILATIGVCSFVRQTIEKIIKKRVIRS